MQELTPDSLHPFNRTLVQHGWEAAVEVSGGFGLSGAGALPEAVEPALGVRRGNESAAICR